MKRDQILSKQELVGIFVLQTRSTGKHMQDWRAAIGTAPPPNSTAVDCLQRDAIDHRSSESHARTISPIVRTPHSTRIQQPLDPSGAIFWHSSVFARRPNRVLICSQVADVLTMLTADLCKSAHGARPCDAKVYVFIEKSIFLPVKGTSGVATYCDYLSLL